MADKPLILVSNDDGHFSMGIRALSSALASFARVVVVAPASDQSAISHAISLNRPLRLNQEESAGDIKIYSVDGTPTDCVYMGLHHVLKNERPDLVVSGINHGANLGYDVFYSGTVSAAMEASMYGITSIAISLVSRHSFKFDIAKDFIADFCQAILQKEWPKSTLFNVNVPKRVTNPQDYAITRLGHHEYTTEVTDRVDPRGIPYYWIGGTWSGYQDLPGTDCNAIAQGLISVTPLALNLTKASLLDELATLKTKAKSIPFYKESK